MNPYNFFHLLSVVLIFFISHSVRGEDNCDLLDDNGNTIKFDKFINNNLGEFDKTIEAAIELPGIQLQNGVTFQKVAMNECDEYLEFTNAGTHVTVTTKDFSNWDTNGNTNGLCNFRLTFENCNFIPGVTNTDIKFFYTIKDVNTMAPEFSAPSYSFKVAYPLPAGLSLTSAYNQPISTLDNDFSTKEVKYSLSGDNANYFQTQMLPKTGKTFPMNLLTTSPLNFQKTMRLTLTATDDGNPPQSSSADIIIEPDELESIPPTPQFADHPAITEIDTEGLAVGDTVFTIALKEDYDNVVITISDSHFGVVKEGIQISAILAEKLDPESTSILVVELIAKISNDKYESSSSTTVVLSLIGTTTTSSTESSTTDSSTSSDSTSDSSTSSTSSDSTSSDSSTSSTSSDSTSSDSSTSSTSSDSTSSDSSTSSTSSDSTSSDSSTSSTSSDSTSSDSSTSSTSSDSTSSDSSTSSTNTDSTSSDSSTSSTSSPGSDTPSTSSDTSPTGSDTSSTVSGTPPTGPTSSPPTCADDPAHCSTDPPGSDDSDGKDGYYAATITLAVITGISLIVIGFGCYKFIYLPYQAGKVAQLNTV